VLLERGRNSPKVPSIYRNESTSGNHPGSLSFFKPVNLRPGVDLNHLWQRFLLASSLIVGIFIGMAVTVFGFNNVTKVDVHWLIFHLNGVPLWTVVVVPLTLFLIAGTLYHWVDGLHHFTEHMRHRRRVHELEAEVASLRAHLDQVLEMPDHSTSKLPGRKGASTVSLPAAGETITDLLPAETEPMPAEVSPEGEAPNTKKSRSAQRKRLALEVAGEPRQPAEPESDPVIGKGNSAEPGDSLEQEA
jgi:uncharacterized integral membrane protein